MLSKIKWLSTKEVNDEISQSMVSYKKPQKYWVIKIENKHYYVFNSNIIMWCKYHKLGKSQNLHGYPIFHFIDVTHLSTHSNAQQN